MSVKKYFTWVLSLIATLGVFPMAACNSASTADDKQAIVINGYENYADLNATSSRGWMHGSIQINTDKKYVSQGQSSAHFSLIQSETRWVSYFKYETANYVEQLRWIDQIESFTFDVYNADDKDYRLYLSAVGDEDYVYASNGTTLVANAWNSVSFDIKPWFFEKDTYVKEYVFYVIGIEQSADLYMDNVRITTYNGNAPKYTKTIDKGFEEQELLSFYTEKDLQFIQTDCGKGSSNEVQRMLSLSHATDVQVGDSLGGMKVTFERCQLNGWSWANATPHTLKVDPRALVNATNATSFEIQCFNPNERDHVVILEAESGDRKASKRVIVPAGKTMKIVLSNLLGIERAENVYIRLDAWDVTSRQTLYFSDFNFTV